MLFDPIQALVDINILSELFLVDCLGSEQFLRKIGLTLKSNPEDSLLRKVYAQFHGPDSCLTDIPDCRKDLTHVSLVLFDGSEARVFSDYVATISPQLKNLGLYFRTTEAGIMVF